MICPLYHLYSSYFSMINIGLSLIETIQLLGYPDLGHLLNAIRHPVRAPSTAAIFEIFHFCDAWRPRDTGNIPTTHRRTRGTGCGWQFRGKGWFSQKPPCPRHVWVPEGNLDMQHSWKSTSCTSLLLENHACPVKFCVYWLLGHFLLCQGFYLYQFNSAEYWLSWSKIGNTLLIKWRTNWGRSLSALRKYNLTPIETYWN